jgi:hypothetical protein
MRIDRGDIGLTGERQLTGQALEHDAAQRVHVGAAVGRFAHDALRREVPDRAGELIAHGRVAGRDHVLGQAEVREVDVLATVLVGDQRVARLDVAVDQAARVCGVECRRELRDERDGAFRRERALAAQQRREVDALEVAHGDEQLPVHVARLVDRHDAGVIDRRGQARLGEEAPPEAILRRDAPRGGASARPDDPGAGRCPHAAAPEQGLDAVAPQLRTNVVTGHRQ